MKTNIINIIKVFKKNKKETVNNFSPLFYSYYKPYFDYPNKILGKEREMEHLLNTVKINNHRKKSIFLDLGCCFGLEGIVLASITSSLNVICIDHNEERIKIGRKFAKTVGAKNIKFVHQKGENLPSTIKADIIFCKSVLSHVNSIEVFFNNIYSNINSNGILYIIDDRNILNPLTIIKTIIIQKKAETPYFEIRKKLIKQSFTYLNDSIINKYSKDTAGLFKDQIISYVNSSEQNKPVSKPNYKHINPMTGESFERLLNPYYLKRILNNCGFTTSIDKPFYGFGSRTGKLKSILGYLIQVLHPFSMTFAPSFHIKAIKTDVRKP